MKTPDGFLTPNGYANHLGITHRAVQKAIESGKLQGAVVQQPNGRLLLDVAKANALWANQQSVHPHNIVSKISTSAAGADSKPPVTLTPQDGMDGNAYQKSRSIREGYMARLAKIEYEERIRQLVPADEVRIAAFNLSRTMRDTLLTIPDRLAPILAHQKEEYQIHLTLREEIERALEQLAEAAKFLDQGE